MLAPLHIAAFPLAAADLGDYAYLAILALAALGEIVRRALEYFRGKPDQPTTQRDAPPAPPTDAQSLPELPRPPERDAPQVLARKPAPIGRDEGHWPRTPAEIEARARDRLAGRPDPGNRPQPAPMPARPAPVGGRRGDAAPPPRRAKRRTEAPIQAEIVTDVVHAAAVETPDVLLATPAARRRIPPQHSALIRSLRTRAGALRAMELSEILAPPVCLRENHLG